MRMIKDENEIMNLIKDGDEQGMRKGGKWFRLNKIKN